MSKQNRVKNPAEKRVPAPKFRREPLPMSISVKHHLPFSADGTATDLTVAELEKVDQNLPLDQELDYSTSQVKTFVPASVSNNKRSKQERTNHPDSSNKAAITLPSKAETKIVADLDLDLDLDFSEDQDLDLDLDLDHKDLDLDFFDQDQDLSKPTRSLIQSNLQQPHKKVTTRSIDNIDLNIQSRFVRVPNWVADQLARQLSPAEEKVFDQIWRLTVGFNREIWRGKIADLMARTGYSSRATVTKALAGLSALSLIVIEGRDTNPRGRSYRIVDKIKSTQQQNTTNNNKSNSETQFLHKKKDQQQNIDHTKLVEPTSSQVKNSNLIKKSMTTQVNSNQLAERQITKPRTETVENQSYTTLTQSSSQAFKNNFRKKDDNSGYSPSSSSRSNDDEEKLFQVKLIYQDLTGNHWSTKDELSYYEIAQIPIPYVILGICYSLTRASEHQISSLKYCIPSIQEHYDLMRAFPHKDLLEIAYRHLVLVKEAQRSGSWSKEVR